MVTTQPTTENIRRWRLKRQLPLYLMLLPAVIGLILFHYYPMYGIIIAFQKYEPLLGFQRSPWVGLGQFKLLFSQPDIWDIMRNTVVIAVSKIIFGQVSSLVFALLLHEVRIAWFKRAIQSLSYVLHFLSWIIFGGMLLDVLASQGIINNALNMLGFARVPFLTNASLFQPTMIGTEVWKEFGFGAVIYLAALTGIDPTLYEAAAVDGASRWKRMIHITLPGIAPTIVLLATLSLGGVLNAGFEQILVLYNPATYSTGDIIDTYVYRAGLLGLQFSLGSAIGLLKGIISLILISLSYYLADRLAGYRIF
jgi:putative aldouronate transport system permease protein